MTDLEALAKGGCDSDQLQRALDLKVLEKKEEYTNKRLKNERQFKEECEAEAEKERLKRDLKTKIEAQVIEEATEAEKNKLLQQHQKDNEKAIEERNSMERASDEELRKKQNALDEAYGERASELFEKTKKITEEHDEAEEEIERLYEKRGKAELEERSETRELSRFLTNEMNDADEKRAEKILEASEAALKAKIDNEKELASKQIDSIKNEKALVVQINEVTKAAQVNLLKMKALSFQNDGIIRFNDTVNSLRDQKDELKDSGDECAIYLDPKIVLNDQKQANAIKHLKTLRDEMNTTNKMLKKLDEDVILLSDKTKHEKYVEQIKQVKKSIGSLGTSIAFFQGRITANLNNWGESKVDEFNEILNKISTGVDGIQLMTTLEAEFLALSQKNQPSIEE